jgi:hypothetical protein
MASCVKRQPIQSEIEKTIDERPVGIITATLGFRASATQARQPIRTAFLLGVFAPVLALPGLRRGRFHSRLAPSGCECAQRGLVR